MFDEADIDAAVARFDELSRPAARLENSATRAVETSGLYFAARDWNGMEELLAEDVFSEDRRSVVNYGIRRGREAELTNWQATADVWTDSASSTLAIRGQRLGLFRFVFYTHDQSPEAFSAEALAVVEVDGDNRITNILVVEPNDFDSAVMELDRWYLAGEAAPHGRTWSAIAQAYAALNRSEMPSTTNDFVDIDHRQLAPLGSGDLRAYLRTALDDAQNYLYVESVHRLTGLGAIVTHVATGTSRDGFDAEWRVTDIYTVDGDLVNRCEMFDEADLDAALARFDQLHPRTPQRENAASRTLDRYYDYFRAGNWAAIADILASDSVVDDRHDVVNSGFWDGRDVVIANLRALADGAPSTATVIATRGERLALGQILSPNRDLQQGEFDVEMLILAEIDADERITAQVAFNVDEIDSAIAELDARYLAGEAAAHAHTWSVIAGMYASFNRHEPPPTTPDWVTVDHRRIATFEFRDANQFFRSTWDLTPDARIHAEAVHRLTSVAALATHVIHATSQEDFDAEWRMCSIVTVQGDQISGCELFDEDDLDVALARFEELQEEAGRLENTASKAVHRLQTAFASGDWTAIAENLAQDIATEDRRRPVNAGIRRGRDAEISGLRAAAAVGTTAITSSLLAFRGRHLVLGRFDFSSNSELRNAFHSEMLGAIETDSDGRVASIVVFDPDEIDSAIAELDARYIAGEAAAHANAWSVIAKSYAATNRHELPPTTPDWENFDHRRAIGFEPGNLKAYLRATFDDLLPDVHVYVEVVHRLSDLGAVVTRFARATSPEGFKAEWREVGLSTVRGDLINRSEMFDEDDLDVALARFEELQENAGRLENTASRVTERFLACYAVRDWEATADTFADDLLTDDRRGVVGAGIRHGRDAQLEDLRAIDDMGITGFTMTVVATRGKHLVLVDVCMSFCHQGSDPFLMEVLAVIEVDVKERMTAIISFNLDNRDAAFAELEARYLAGEGAAHAE